MRNVQPPTTCISDSMRCTTYIVTCATGTLIQARARDERCEKAAGGTHHRLSLSRETVGKRYKREKKNRGSLTVRQLPQYLQSRSDALSMKSYIRADRKCKSTPHPAHSGDVIYGNTYIFNLSSERHAHLFIYFLRDREQIVVAGCKIAIFKLDKPE